MPKPPSPGQPMLLPVLTQCECRWQGFAQDKAEALQMWTEHAERAGHKPGTTHIESE